MSTTCLFKMHANQLTPIPLQSLSKTMEALANNPAIVKHIEQETKKLIDFLLNDKELLKRYSSYIDRESQPMLRLRYSINFVLHDLLPAYHDSTGNTANMPALGITYCANKLLEEYLSQKG